MQHNLRAGGRERLDSGQGVAYIELPTPAGTLFINMADPAVMEALSRVTGTSDNGCSSESPRSKVLSSTGMQTRACQSSCSVEFEPHSLGGRKSSLTSARRKSDLFMPRYKSLSRRPSKDDLTGLPPQLPKSLNLPGKGKLADLLASGEHERLAAMSDTQTAEVHRPAAGPASHTASRPRLAGILFACARLRFWPPEPDLTCAS